MNTYRTRSSSPAGRRQVASKPKGATPRKKHCAKSETTNYSLLFPAFLALAHLAFASATSLALPAAEIFLLGFWTGAAGAFAPLIFAHLALAAAAILALPAALILHFFFGALVGTGAEAPSSWLSAFCSDWIFSCKFAA